MGQNIYMLPSDMNLKIKTGTVRYNNKILVSDGKFSLGKNENVNALVLQPVITKGVVFCVVVPKGHLSHGVAARPWAHRAHKVVAQQTQAKKPTTHKDEKIALVLFLAGGFTIWNIFR